MEWGGEECLRGHDYGNSLFFIVTAHTVPILLREFGSCRVKSLICPLLTRTDRLRTQHHRCFSLLELASQSDESRGPWSVTFGCSPENLEQGQIQRKHSVIGFFSLQSTLKSRLKAAMFPVLPDTCHTHEKLLALLYRRTL